MNHPQHYPQPQPVSFGQVAAALTAMGLPPIASPGAQRISLLTAPTVPMIVVAGVVCDACLDELELQRARLPLDVVYVSPQAPSPVEIQNEYWDELYRLIETGAVDYDKTSRTVKTISGNATTLNLLGLRFSPTISDPDLVEYVAKVCGNSVVEIGAGNGYWSYLLHQHGKKVTAYDTDPPRTGWVYKIHRLDMFRRVLAVHDNDTLMCMSDRYPFNAFVKAVKRFNGNRMLLSAERDPATTSALREVLEREWVLASHLKGVTRQLIPRVVYEYQRKTAAWNQQTRLMPLYTPTGGDR